MLAIQKRFPVGKGVTVGSLALVAGFLSSVAVLNMITGTEPNAPVANVRTADDQGAVLGTEADKKEASTQRSTESGTSLDGNSSSQNLTPLTWEKSVHRPANSAPAGGSAATNPVPVAPPADEVTVPEPTETVEPVDPPDDPSLPIVDPLLNNVQQSVPTVEAELNLGL